MSIISRALVALLALAPVSAMAQSSPELILGPSNWHTNVIPTTLQWDLLFSSKQDVIGYGIGMSGAAIPLLNAANTASGLWTFTNNIYLPLTLSPSSTPGPTTRGIYAYENMTGSCSGDCKYNVLSVNSDNIPVGGNGIGWYINHNYGGSAMTGNRAAFNSTGLMTARTGNTNTASYSAGVFQNTVTANDGGTGVTTTTAQGQNEVVNVILKATSGATNWRAMQGGEVDTMLQTGTSTYQKSGWQITELASDQVAGSVYDGALVLSNAASAATISSGAYSGSSITLTIAPTTPSLIDSGSLVVIAGASPSCANGAYVGTRSGTTLTYTAPSCSGSGSVTGSSATATESSIGWKNGIVFGGFQGSANGNGWPFQTSATAIGCVDGCGTLTNVLDFSGATITGYFLRGPSFTVSGSGAVSASSVTDTGALSAASATISGGLVAGTVTSSGNATVASLTASGNVSAASVTISGAATASSLTASGSVGAASVTASGAISAASVTSSGAVTASAVNSWPVGAYLATVINPGTSAAPGDVITPTVPGATANANAKIAVASTQVVGIAAGAAGSGCTNGTYSVTGTTGAATASSLWTGTATITGGGTISSISLTTGGQYGRSGGNPTLSGDPLSGVTGCSVAPKAALTMGAKYLTIDGQTQLGSYSQVPGGTATVTAYSSTGSESGLSFSLQFAPLAAGVIPQSQASGGGNAGDIWNAWLGNQACGSLAGLGVENTCIGNLTGSILTVGNFNTFVGNVAGWALDNSTGNSVLGSDAERNLQAATDTTSLGHYALAGPPCSNGNSGCGGTVNYSLAAGSYALRYATTGATGLVALGYQAGMAGTGTIPANTSKNSNFIGNQVGSSAAYGVQRETYIGTGPNCDAASGTETDGFHVCASTGTTNAIDVNTTAGAIAVTVNGNLTATGSVNAASAAISGAATAASVTASGAVSAASASISGAVSAASVTTTGVVTVGGVINATMLQASKAYSGSGSNALPVCNSTTARSIAWVSDGVSLTSACGTTYTPGAGTSTDMVACDGTSWTYH